MNDTSVTIRHVSPGDASATGDICNKAILGTTATFDTSDRVEHHFGDVE